MQWSRSCGLLHLCVQLVERRFAPRTPAWTNVADQRFGFHDAHVWFFINRQEIIRTVTNGNAAALYQEALTAAAQTAQRIVAYRLREGVNVSAARASRI